MKRNVRKSNIIRKVFYGISIVALAALLPANATKTTKAATGTNLVSNPGFENGTNNWYYYRAVLGNNNPRTGLNQISLESGYIWQEIVAQESGYYVASGWFSTGEAGTKLNIYNQSTGNLTQSKNIGILSTAYEKVCLDPVYFEKGTVIKLEAVGNGTWSDVDDFELYFLGATYNY